MAAPLAGISPPLGDLREGGVRAAAGARNLRPAVLDFHDRREAGVIVRVLGLELLECVLAHSGHPLLVVRG